MKARPIVIILTGWLATTLFTGCATPKAKEAVPVETIPIVRIAPNSSGIDVETSRPHGPYNLLGATGVAPDVPSGISVSLRRIQPLHNTEPRYFTPASGVLQVVSIERPADYGTQYASFADTIHKWRLLLDSAGIPDDEARTVLYAHQLSEIPWVDGGRCFHARLRFEKFPWGKAVIFLTSYVQGKTGGPVNNDMLVFVVQGITTDGRYAVNGHFEIRHPKLPNSSWDKSTREKAVFDIDNEDEKAEKWLDSQSDDSFEPTFLQYDTFLKSLQIEPPATK